MFSVALDAMGGDYGPSETVEAALKIVNEYGYVIYLVGDETQISNELESKNYDKSCAQPQGTELLYQTLTTAHTWMQVFLKGNLHPAVFDSVHVCLGSGVDA